MGILVKVIAGSLLFYFVHWSVKIIELSPASGSTMDFLGLSRFRYALEHLSEFPLFDFQFTWLSFGLATYVSLMLCLILFRSEKAEIRRIGEEHGSAYFLKKSELKGFADEEEDLNILYTRYVKLALYNKRLPFDKQVNKNVFGVGTSGDGKTLTFTKPNLAQANSSYVVTDTKGLLVRETGMMMKEMGYKIKIFDLVNLSNSDSFNVFHYMSSELDIDRAAEAIVSSTQKGGKKSEDFWQQAEMLLMRSLLAYLYFDSKASHYDAHLGQIVDLLRVMNRIDPEVPSPLEYMFEALEEKLPGNYAFKEWKLFNDSFSGQTRTSVQAIVASRFSVFDHDDVVRMIHKDTMEINNWQKEKTIVYVTIPETNDAFSFLSTLFFSTVFDMSIRTADRILQGDDPHFKASDLIHLQMYLDEFANIGKLPNVSSVLSVVRSREISLKILVQAISQVDTLYGKEERKSIINNCGVLLYLGTNDIETMRFFSERSGKQTIVDQNTSRSYGQSGSSSTSKTKLGRDLMTPHEIATIGIDEALVFISKQNVFKDKKTLVFHHKRAHLLANSPEDKNWYRYYRNMDQLDPVVEMYKEATTIRDIPAPF